MLDNDFENAFMHQKIDKILQKEFHYECFEEIGFSKSDLVYFAVKSASNGSLP